jgi:hypothetical protein
MRAVDSCGLTKAEISSKLTQLKEKRKESVSFLFGFISALFVKFVAFTAKLKTWPFI